MKNKILVVLLALSLTCVFSGGALAGVLGYSLDRAGMRSFTEPPPKESPAPRWSPPMP